MAQTATVAHKQHATRTEKASATKTANPSKPRDKQLDKTNLQKATKDAVAAGTERELKYLYPEGIKSNADKKTFRRQARATNAKFQAEIKKLQQSKEEGADKELAKKEKEFKAWQKETYSHPA